MKLTPFHRFVGVRYFWEQYFVFTPFSKIIITTFLRWQAQPAIWCCFGSCCWEVEWMWRPPAASGGLQQHWEGDSCKYKHGLIPRPCGLGMRPCWCPVSVHSECKTHIGVFQLVLITMCLCFLSRCSSQGWQQRRGDTSMSSPPPSMRKRRYPNTLYLRNYVSMYGVLMSSSELQSCWHQHYWTWGGD